VRRRHGSGNKTLGDRSIEFEASKRVRLEVPVN